MALSEAWIQVFNYVKHTNAIYDEKTNYYIDHLFIGSNVIFWTSKKTDHYGCA